MLEALCTLAWVIGPVPCLGAMLLCGIVVLIAFAGGDS